MGLPTMRIQIDTDVLLDFAIGREPFFTESKQIMVWARDNPGDASVAWHSLSNLAYLMSGDVRGFLQDLLNCIVVPTVGTSNAIQALQFPMVDVEDAMQVPLPWHFARSGLLHVMSVIIEARLCPPNPHEIFSNRSPHHRPLTNSLPQFR